MPKTPNKTKQADKDNGYHPFAKEEKDLKTAARQKSRKLGNGLMGNNTLHAPFVMGTPNKPTSEVNTNISDFLLQLSNINLRKWEDLTDEHKQPSKGFETESRSKPVNNASVGGKDVKTTVEAGEKTGKDYGGSYLFTKKPENTDKIQAGDPSTPPNKGEAYTQVQPNKPKPKLPPNAVRLGNKPTQLVNGSPVGTSLKARESMRLTELRSSGKTNDVLVQVKIDEKAYEDAREKCLLSIEKLMDYLNRPPKIKIPAETVHKFTSMQTELCNQLNSLVKSLENSARVLSRNVSAAQSLSKLVTILDNNVGSLLEGSSKAPVKLAQVFEPIKEETLQFKRSLQSLADCLHCNMNGE